MTPPIQPLIHSLRRHKLVLPAAVLMSVLFLSGYSTLSLAAVATDRQQAIEMALQQNGGDGKVLGVKTSQNQNGQTVFAVKVLANGRVHVFRFLKAR